MAMGEINDSFDRIDAKMRELAALVQGVRTYDPKTQVVISKDDAELFLFACEEFGRLWVYSRTNRGRLTEEAADRLRAAMESNKGEAE